jgi:hypothetical protein
MGSARRRKTATVVLPLLVAALTAGCAQQSEPSTFYRLAPPAEASAEAGTTLRDGVAVLLGPVSIASHLDRASIVLRATDTRLIVDDLNRWGGSLDENLSMVVADSLSTSLSTDRVAIYPGIAAWQPDYQVLIDVTTFEADAAGDVVLSAHWTLIDAARREVLAMARSRLVDRWAGDAPPDSPDFDRIATVMSRLAAELGRDIAARIQARL